MEIIRNVAAVRSLLLASLFFLPVLVIAAPQTDAEIRNYLENEITIEYKIVTVGGIKWQSIGTIKAKSAKIFPKISVGTELRASMKNREVKRFTIKNPPPGSNQVVFNIKNR